MLLQRVLDRHVAVGALTVIDAHGRRHEAGDGTGRPVTLRLHDRWLPLKMALAPDLAVGEAYMDGRLTLDGDLWEFFDLVGRNLALRPPPRRRSWGLHRLHQVNPAARSRRNVAHHYDLSGQLFQLLLDREQHYSCAYFARPDLTLEQAQQAKARHIAAKLHLAPGQRVLDIGSGWGALALYLAKVADVEVLGVTLSEEQLAAARARAAAAGLADRVRFALTDYRAVEGRFDRIVSVGMFEHVGAPHYPRFFAQVRDLLADDGIALLRSIGRHDGPGATDAWTRRYIFPGGYVPALSEVVPAIERAGLWITDVEILRLHYAETLRHWRRRFLANRDQVRAIYDERFCRMWEFYLAGSEMGFRYGGLMVMQVQLARQVDAVPLTRDVAQARERALA